MITAFLLGVGFMAGVLFSLVVYLNIQEMRGPRA